MSDTIAVQEAPSLRETEERMLSRLSRFLPEFEIRLKAELAYEINLSLIHI